MSIAYLLTCYPTAYETFVRREVRDLKARGVPVRVVVSLRPGLPAAEDEGPVLTPGPPPRWLAGAALQALRHPWRLLRVVALAVRLDLRCPLSVSAGRGSIAKSLLLLPMLLEVDRRLPGDVRHIHAHFAGIATTAACLLAAWRGCGFSFTAHGSDIYVYPPSDLPLRLRLARACITVSDFNRRHLLGRGAADLADKIHVVRCGIPVSEFEPPAPRRLGSPPRLLSVARLDPVKGLDCFLDALADYRRAGGPELRYDILGEGPQRAELEAQAGRAGLGDWVRFHGLAGAGDVRAALARADLFVLPSRSEGFPVVLMEAAAARLPLLAPRITGIPEILEDGLNGRFLTPDDRSQQCAALLALARDDWSDLKRLIQGAAGLDLDPFDAERTGQALAERLWTLIR